MHPPSPGQDREHVPAGAGARAGRLPTAPRHAQPNQALEPTPNSFRSSLASAFGRGSPPALGVMIVYPIYRKECITMTVSRNAKAILTAFIREVWSEGNVEASDKYIAPHYTILHDPGDPWEGHALDLAGYKERVRALRSAFPDQFFDIQGLFAEGDAVVMTWLWSATHQGDLPGFPATGTPITMSGATVYFFEGDRLAAHWQITDRLGVYQQLQRAKVGV